MSALIVDATVRDGEIHVVDEFYKARRVKAAKGWGDGCALKIRIEPEEDARSWGQHKHFFGHVVEPLSEWNGEFPDEWEVRLKLMFMPEGKTSITQLSWKEFDTFIRRCEVYAYTAHPEAFVLYDLRTG